MNKKYVIVLGVLAIMLYFAAVYSIVFGNTAANQNSQANEGDPEQEDVTVIQGDYDESGQPILYYDNEKDPDNSDVVEDRSVAEHIAKNNEITGLWQCADGNVYLILDESFQDRRSGDGYQYEFDGSNGSLILHNGDADKQSKKFTATASSSALFLTDESGKKTTCTGKDS